MQLFVACVENGVDPGAYFTVLAVLDDVGVEAGPPEREEQEVLCASLAIVSCVCVSFGENAWSVLWVGTDYGGSVCHDAVQRVALESERGCSPGDAPSGLWGSSVLACC